MVRHRSAARTAAISPRIHAGPTVALRVAMNHIALPALVACLSLSAVACSASTATAPRSPSVAFEAPASAVQDACSLEGMPRVVATHVAPKDGVSAVAADGKIWLRFGTTHDPRVSLAL